MKTIIKFALLTILGLNSFANLSFLSPAIVKLNIDKRYENTMTNSGFSNIKQASFTEYSAYIAQRDEKFKKEKDIKPIEKEYFYKMDQLITLNIKNKTSK